MAHISEKRWAEVSGTVAEFSRETLSLLARAREYSIQLFIMYVGAGNTDAGFARQLFKDEIAARQRDSDEAYFRDNPEGTDPPVVGPTAQELLMVKDARDAMSAINELWEAANNVAVTQKDRSNLIRKMP